MNAALQVDTPPSTRQVVAMPPQNTQDVQFPPVVVEKLVTPFKYWDESIQNGMRYQNELYTQLQRFSTDDRLQAYAQGYEEVLAGHKVCITVSERGYVLWRALRASN